MSGEGHAHGLSVLIEELIAEHTAKGTLRQGDSPYAAPPPPATALRFPGKAAVLPDGSFLVSDTTHHELVHLEADLVTERARFGGAGVLNEPQGVLVIPPETAERVGYDVVVADSVHHQVKGLRLEDGSFTVLAGTGRRGNATVYVSRGVGTVYVPVRINCPPDVSVLTLRGKVKSEK